MDLNDFRDFFDYVFYYSEGLRNASDGLASEGRWGKLHHEEDSGKVGVGRVACREDQDKGVPESSSLEISKRHPAFRNADDPPSIAEIINYGLCETFAYEALQPQVSAEKTAKPRNPAIEALYCELGRLGFFKFKRAEIGTTRNGIMNGSGSKLLLDKRKRPLDVDFANALCKLCRTQIIPLAKRRHNSGIETEELHDEMRELVSSWLPDFD